MDKIQKHNWFNSNTPSSESYRNHPVVSFCEHGNESSGSINKVGYFYKLSDVQFFKYFAIGHK
jgi:hypothetical protein